MVRSITKMYSALTGNVHYSSASVRLIGSSTALNVTRNRRRNNIKVHST